MNIVLKPWTRKDKDILKDLCNHIDRSHLSDRIPSPYTEQDAIWWLTMVEEHEGKDGIFRQGGGCQAACFGACHDQIFQKNRVFRVSGIPVFI